MAAARARGSVAVSVAARVAKAAAVGLPVPSTSLTDTGPDRVAMEDWHATVR